MPTITKFFSKFFRPKYTTLEEFNIRYSICANREDVDGLIKSLSCPSKLKGKEVPSNLNELSYGKLIAIQQGISQGATDLEKISNSAYVLLGVTLTSKDKAEDVLGFGRWIAEELTKINQLFASIQTSPTAEEVQAGVKELNFGHFGTMDWYARRMRITDHAEVEKVPWVRIYKCMEMDNKQAQYERRLRQIYTQKYR